MTKRKNPEDLLPQGRPTSFSEDIASEICRRLSQGEPIARMSKEKDMPSQATIYLWLQKYPSFLEMYTRAREDQADTLADEIVAIADEQPEIIEVKDKEGNVIDHKLDSAFLAWQKNRIDARKWTAMKLKPKKYGDKVTHSGDDENPIVTENHVNVFGELLKAIKLERMSQD